MSAYDANYVAIGPTQTRYPQAPPKRYASVERSSKKSVAAMTSSVIAFQPRQCNYAPVPTRSKTIHYGTGYHASV